MTKYLTTREFADRARTTESTVRYWRYTGYGPSGFRVGRRTLYLEEEIEQWLEGLRNAATSREQ